MNKTQTYTRTINLKVIQWTGDNLEEIREFVKRHKLIYREYIVKANSNLELSILDDDDWNDGFCIEKGSYITVDDSGEIDGMNKYYLKKFYQFVKE